MQLLRRLAAAFAFTLGGVLASAGPVHAQLPRPWEMGMQVAHSPVQARIESLHTLVLWIITLVTLFVGALLVWVLFRYNARANPTPGRTTHHTLLEVAWTVVPVLILAIIVIPSFRLVYYEDRTASADMTVKVTGHQWYWEYAYPDQNNIDFTSYIVKDADLKPGQPRLLTVDNPLVVPAGKNIRILATSSDVIHSFFIPSLGVQRYAIPGRMIETWFRADQPGEYHGECNQICGTNHSFMPIVIKAVTPEEFQAWVKDAKTRFAANPPEDPSRFAAASAQVQ
ncbi:MAG TPA: cytochrome c oxidase subunit II [Acetobacteraceae bacterium]|nr:cytochrome c oxidase subunit II [Acetobacteraceae bacterium]